MIPVRLRREVTIICYHLPRIGNISPFMFPLKLNSIWTINSEDPSLAISGTDSLEVPTIYMAYVKAM